MKKSGKIIFLISLVLVAISLVVCGFWHWQEGHHYNVELYEFSENAVFSDLAHVDGVDYRYQIDENSPAHYIVRYSYDTKKTDKIRINEPSDYYIPNTPDKIEEGEFVNTEAFVGTIAASKQHIYILYKHFVMGGEMKTENYDIFYELYQYDLNGQFIQKTFLDLDSDFAALDICADDAYMYFLMSNEENSYIDVYTFSGEYHGRIQTNVTEETNEPILISAKEQGVLLTSGAKLYLLRGTELCEIDIKCDAVIQSDDETYDFVYYKKNKLYGYNIESNTSKKIFGAEIEDISLMCLFYKNKLWGVRQTSLSEAKLIEITFGKRNKEEVEDAKKTLCYAMLNDGMEPVALIDEFNKTNSGYTIEIKKFETPALLNEALLRGEQIDLFDLSAVDYDTYVEKGLLEDIYLLMEADEEMSLNDFQPEMLDSLETNGELYRAVPGVFIETIIVNNPKGTNNDWNMDMMWQLAQENPNAHTAEEMIAYSYICRKEMLVNEKDKSCHFEELNFVEDLQRAKAFPVTELEIYSIEHGEMDDIYLPSFLTAGGFAAVELTYRDVAFINFFNEKNNGGMYIGGYPTESGNISYIYPGQQIGVNSACTDKEMAWKFIKPLFSADYQLRECYHSGMFPSRKDSLASLNLTICTAEGYDDEVLGYVPPFSSNIAFGLVISDEPFGETDIVSTEKTQNFLSKIEMLDMDETILSIIKEESTAYFAGTQTDIVSCENMDNRIFVYLNE